MAKKKTAAEKTISAVLRRGQAGKLHHGSKKGPIVTNPKEETAIALSVARKRGEKVSPKKKK